VSRKRQHSEWTISDLLVVAVGAGLGLALGYFAAERVGRVNTRRVQSAIERWKRRHAGPTEPWTEEDGERLEARVLHALRRDAVLGRRAVRVRVFEGGIVELSGRVAHASEVPLAGRVVGAVPEVRTILNHLLVTGADGPVPAAAGPTTPRAARG
jgi:hypothetical protein